VPATTRAHEQPVQVIDSALEYVPGDPVRVWARHRDHRITVSDRGAALERVGAPDGWRHACARVLAELDVNITRGGVVWLPVVPIGPAEEAVARRVARASLIFFQELLELPATGGWTSRTDPIVARLELLILGHEVSERRGHEPGIDWSP